MGAKRRQIRDVMKQLTKSEPAALAVLPAGVPLPEDPLFWFARHNYPLYTYPVKDMTRYIREGETLRFHYSDMVSRTGTPEERDAMRQETFDDEERRAKSLQNQSETIPPSINLCQPTEGGTWARQRWEVEKKFVDGAKSILGDSCWFPGALGYRFTFEVKT